MSSFSLTRSKQPASLLSSAAFSTASMLPGTAQKKNHSEKQRNRKLVHTRYSSSAAFSGATHRRVFIVDLYIGGASHFTHFTHFIPHFTHFTEHTATRVFCTTADISAAAALLRSTPNCASGHRNTQQSSEEEHTATHAATHMHATPSVPL